MQPFSTDFSSKGIFSSTEKKFPNKTVSIAGNNDTSFAIELPSNIVMHLINIISLTWCYNQKD